MGSVQAMHLGWCETGGDRSLGPLARFFSICNCCIFLYPRWWLLSSMFLGKPPMFSDLMGHMVPTRWWLKTGEFSNLGELLTLAAVEVANHQTYPTVGLQVTWRLRCAVLACWQNLANQLVNIQSIPNCRCLLNFPHPTSNPRRRTWLDMIAKGKCNDWVPVTENMGSIGGSSFPTQVKVECIIIWYDMSLMNSYIWYAMHSHDLGGLDLGNLVNSVIWEWYCHSASSIHGISCSSTRTWRYLPSLKLTAHTWKWMVGRRSFPFGGPAHFQGGAVSFRECMYVCFVDIEKQCFLSWHCSWYCSSSPARHWSRLRFFSQHVIKLPTFWYLLGVILRDFP